MRGIVYAVFACLGGVLVGASCQRIGLATIAFTCSPAGPLQPPCPESFGCCSDDGTTVGPFAVFSHEANDVCQTGMCVRLSDIPPGSGLSKGCPIPCNPLWPNERIDEVCGETRACCQTQELVEADCVFDEAEGLFVPMDGRDAEAALLAGKDRWGNGTHQDPEFEACEALAGNRNNSVFLDCVRSLTVANQRGYCMAIQPGGVCPTAKPEYTDACEAMNE